LIQVAHEHLRCIKEPQPVCILPNFGDSSVDFLLHFWVKNVENDRWQPQSEVMFNIWKKSADNNIMIPFPQRDLHLRSGNPLSGDADE
jgi:small-conductance mechanosensitive channel